MNTVIMLVLYVNEHIVTLINILSRVYGSVINNNGFWIGLLDLLTPFLTIIRNHNQLHELTIKLQPKPSSLATGDSPHSRSHSTTDSLLFHSTTLSSLI
jgi:hypothetical protein